MAYRGNQLGLHEELVLLALEDRSGEFQWQSWGYSVGGAIIAELLLNERIETEEEQDSPSRASNPLVNVLDDEPLGCPLLDEALERMATAKRRARIGEWINRFSTRKNMHRDIALQLCRRGILREDEASLMLFFKKKVYPEVNPVPERRMVERLEKAIFGEGRVDDRTAALVALADASKLLSIPFDAKRLKKRATRIRAIREGQGTGAAEAVKALNTTMDVVMIINTMN